MSRTYKKKRFRFWKLLIWIVVIVVALNTISDGKFGDWLSALVQDGSSYQTEPTDGQTNGPEETEPGAANPSIPNPTDPEPTDPEPTENNASQIDRLPSVPEALRNHVYLGSRDRGYCEKLTGKVFTPVLPFL